MPIAHLTGEPYINIPSDPVPFKIVGPRHYDSTLKLNFPCNMLLCDFATGLATGRARRYCLGAMQFEVD